MAVPPDHWTHVDYGYSDIGDLVTDTRVIPEFIGKNCRADLIAPALLETLNAPQGQLGALNDTMDKLGRGHHRLGHRRLDP